MRMLLEQMGAGGADVVKLAVMPQNHSDVLALLTETNRFHETYPNQPLVTMSMGAIGCVSRVVGEAFGSCITFGAQGRASAPGQLPADRLSEVLTVLHESMEG
jgi:3-dehydroquinate dehydratase-1